MAKASKRIEVESNVLEILRFPVVLLPLVASRVSLRRSGTAMRSTETLESEGFVGRSESFLQRLGAGEDRE